MKTSDFFVSCVEGSGFCPLKVGALNGNSNWSLPFEKHRVPTGYGLPERLEESSPDV